MTTGGDGQAYRGRFAPSPTGDLHFGSLVAALASWLRARSRAGAWLVRMEDLDPPREVPGAARRILDTLAAFGMVGDEPVLWQHDRLGAYDTALAGLRDAGALFECRCSRSALGEGAVHRTCLPAPPGSEARTPALRLRVPDVEVAFVDLVQGPQRQHVAREVGDFVLRRADGLHAYQLAVVVDDAFQGITEVVRGADLLDSTPRQLLLQRALGLATPAYAHVPLVVDERGEKLSKQLASAPVDGGDPLPALRRALAFLGQDPQSRATSVAALLAAATRSFAPGAIPRRARAGAPDRGA
jgi:glutamyl-Q tRNA(Asp) synthetase